MSPKKFIDCRDIDWFVDGVIAETGITLLSGDPGEGKTSLAIQLAHCMMTGVPFMKQHTIKGKALVVCQDESPEYVKDKIKHMLPQLPRLKELEYHDEYFTPVIPQKCASLAVASEGYKLLIVDSLGAVDAGSENDAEAMTRCMQVLRRIAERNNLGVLLLHHLRKPRGDDFETTESRIAGSYGIQRSVDQMLSLYSQGGYAVLQTHSKKFRGDRTFWKLVMKFDSTTLTFKLKKLIKKRD